MFDETGPKTPLRVAMSRPAPVLDGLETVSVNCLVVPAVTVSGPFSNAETSVVAEEPWHPPQPDVDVFLVLPVLPSGSPYKEILIEKNKIKSDAAKKLIFNLFILKYFKLINNCTQSISVPEQKTEFMK